MKAGILCGFLECNRVGLGYWIAQKLANDFHRHLSMSEEIYKGFGWFRKSWVLRWKSRISFLTRGVIYEHFGDLSGKKRN
jgi:hypothetical protein